MLLGVQWLSKHKSLKTWVVSSQTEWGLWKGTIPWVAMLSTRHPLLPEAVPALTVRLKSNVRFFALTERPISTPLQIQAFQYIRQVYKPATHGCLSLSSKAWNRKAKINVIFFWEILLTVLKTNYNDGKCSYLSLYFGQFRFLIDKHFTFTLKTMTYYT